MQKFATFLVIAFTCVIVMCAMPVTAQSGTTVITAKVGLHANMTRLVLALSGPVNYKVFTLSAPNRLVIDLEDASWRVAGAPIRNGAGLIESLRYGQSAGGRIRVVADLRKAAQVKKTFVLLPNGSQPYRLVIDVKADGRHTQALTRPALDEDVTIIGRTGRVSPPARPTDLRKQMPATARIPYPPKKPRIWTVVLDPGHGGKDPGAIGRAGTREKNITLATAREVRRALQALGVYKVLLTRERDQFIPLRDRVTYARNANADVFVSIHADSQNNRRTRGASVYTLSERASDTEAAALAERENKAGLINGLDLSTNPRAVTNILIDLAQRQTMNRSAQLASIVVRELDQEVLMLANSHRFAGFAVLKGPDIPSVLIELGFLSNRADEALLRKASHRRQVAMALATAIDSYFKDVEIASLQ